MELNRLERAADTTHTLADRVTRAASMVGPVGRLRVVGIRVEIPLVSMGF